MIKYITTLMLMTSLAYGAEYKVWHEGNASKGGISDATGGSILADGSTAFTGDQDHGTNAITGVSSLQLTGGTGTQGTLNWNSDEETANLILNDAVLQLGQEMHYHVKNQTGSLIAVGTPVYASGTLGTSTIILISPFVADGSVPAYLFLGATTSDIANGGTGKVTKFGKVRGLSFLSAFADEALLYPSATEAGWTNVAPVRPNIAMPCAFIIDATPSGTMQVRVNNLDLNQYATYTELDAKVNVAGDTITGNMTFGNGVDAAPSITFVDGAGEYGSLSLTTSDVHLWAQNTLSLSSDDLSITVGSSKITALGTGTADTDAVNVGQMNTAIAAGGGGGGGGGFPVTYITGLANGSAPDTAQVIDSLGNPKTVVVWDGVHDSGKWLDAVQLSASNAITVTAGICVTNSGWTADWAVKIKTSTGTTTGSYVSVSGYDAYDDFVNITHTATGDVEFAVSIVSEDGESGFSWSRFIEYQLVAE